jgi:beta-fructofuranosidase
MTTTADSTGLRPWLHYAPAQGWVNDPLALTYHDGRYHLFFQYVPGRTAWAPDCRWGHATSDDLLHWETGPVALEPDDHEDGCWSGNLVRPGSGAPTIFYTAVTEPDVQVGRVRTARPLDDGWVRWEQGDTVATLPPDEDAVAFRDPFVYRDGETWRMLVGGGTTDGTAVAWAYSSPDLASWTYEGRAADRHVSEGAPPGVPASGDVWTGSVWECPVLVDLGQGRHALVVSVWEPGTPYYVAYSLCRLDGHRLETGPWRRLTYGPSCYAASTFVDADGRPGLVHWLREVADVEAGWAGAHSLPQRLSLEGDRLVAVPHPDLDRLRADPLDLPDEGCAVRGPVDVVWEAQPGDRLRHGSLTVTAGDGELRAVTGEHDVVVPWSSGSVRLVLDGPVAELYVTDGVVALPVRAEVDAVLSVQGAGRARRFVCDSPA